MSTGKRTFRGVDEDILVPILARIDTIRTKLGANGPNALAPVSEAAKPSRERALLENIEREISDLRHRFDRINLHEKEMRQRFDPVEEHIDDALQSLQDKSPLDVYNEPSAVAARLKGIRDMVNERYNLSWEYAPGEQSSQTSMASAAATTRTITKRMQEIRHGPQMHHLRLAVGGLETRLRGCVLCLAAFPEGAIIKKRLLIHWWIGEGFVHSAGEGKGRFDELADKGFLIPVRRGLCGTAHRCVVRPWMRDLLINVARSAAFLEPDSGNDFAVARRACLRGGKITSSKFDNELRAIYNIDKKYVELDEGWFAGKEELRTLQLGQWRELGPREQIDKPMGGHVEVSRTELFADMAVSCKNLRYISFRGISRIDSLPDAIGRLREHVVLDLRACHNLENLGEGIVKLVKLEYLDVSDCHLLVGMPKELGKLSKLEVLKGFVVISSNTKDQYCSLGDMITDKLRKLSISISKMDDTTEVELRSLVNFNAVESLTITWGVVDSKKEGGGETPVESKSKGADGDGEITPATIAEKKGHEGTPMSSIEHEGSAKEGGDKKTSAASEKEGDRKASTALKMEGDEETQGTSQKIGSDQEEGPLSSGKEGVIDTSVTSDNKVDEESTKKEGVEEPPVALKKVPNEEASNVNSKKEDDEAASVSSRKGGVEDAPVSTGNKVDKESTKKEVNEESPVALKKLGKETSKVNSKKQDGEAASVSFTKEGVEDAPMTSDNKVDKESMKKEGDEESPVALMEPNEETSKVNPKKEDDMAALVSLSNEGVEDAPMTTDNRVDKESMKKEGDEISPMTLEKEREEEGSVTFKQAGSEETLAVTSKMTSNKEHGQQALVTGDHDEASKKKNVDGEAFVACKAEGAKMDFALPPKLKKLDLRCFPLTEIPKWDGLKSTVRKLYIRGGKLTSLGDGETWEVEVLRLRFLRALHYDRDKFRGSFKKLKPEYVEIYECSIVRSIILDGIKQDSTGSQGGAVQAEAK